MKKFEINLQWHKGQTALDYVYAIDGLNTLVKYHIYDEIKVTVGGGWIRSLNAVKEEVESNPDLNLENRDECFWNYVTNWNELWDEVKKEYKETGDVEIYSYYDYRDYILKLGKDRCDDTDLERFLDELYSIMYAGELFDECPELVEEDIA